MLYVLVGILIVLYVFPLYVISDSVFFHVVMGCDIEGTIVHSTVYAILIVFEYCHNYSGVSGISSVG